MPKRSPFKRHRFPAKITLLAVRWYCRYPLSYRDVRDLLAERGIHVDPATISRWVVKFGPEIAKRSFTHRSWRGLTWHVDETYVRVGGQWRYLWRAVDPHGQLADFRLTAPRCKGSEGIPASGDRQCASLPAEDNRDGQGADLCACHRGHQQTQFQPRACPVEARMAGKTSVSRALRSFLAAAR